MGRLKTLSTYQKELKVLFSGATKALEYNGAMQPAKHYCRQCKDTYEVSPNTILNNKTICCPTCRYTRSSLGIQKMTTGEFAAEVIKLSKGNAKVVGEYKGHQRKVRVRCLIHNHVEEKMANLFLAGMFCLKCSSETGKRRKHAVARQVLKPDYVIRLKQAQPKLRLLGEWQGMSKKTDHKCLICKHKWLAKPAALVLETVSRTGCPNCAQLKTSLRITAKPYTLGKKEISVQGFEAQALDSLLAEGVKTSHIIAGNMGGKPMFPYMLGRHDHRYYPDIYLPRTMEVIEVKSTYTFFGGYCRGRGVSTQVLKAKRQAVVNAGFKFRLMLMSAKGKQIRLPKNWWTLTTNGLRSHLAKHR